MDFGRQDSSNRKAQIFLVGLGADPEALKLFRRLWLKDLDRVAIFLMRETAAQEGAYPVLLEPADAAYETAEAEANPTCAILIAERPSDLCASPFLERIREEFEHLRCRPGGFLAVAALTGGEAGEIESPHPALGEAAPLFHGLFKLGAFSRGRRFGPGHWEPLRRLVDLARDPQEGWPELRLKAREAGLEEPPLLSEPADEQESAAQLRRISLLLRRAERRTPRNPNLILPLAAETPQERLLNMDRRWAAWLAERKREIEALPPLSEPGRRALEEAAARLRRSRDQGLAHLRREGPVSSPPLAEGGFAEEEPPPERAAASAFAWISAALGSPTLLLALVWLRLREARNDGLPFDAERLADLPLAPMVFPGAAGAVLAVALAWRARRLRTRAADLAAREAEILRREDQAKAARTRHMRLRAILANREFERMLLKRARTAEEAPRLLAQAAPAPLPFQEQDFEAEAKEAAI